MRSDCSSLLANSGPRAAVTALRERLDPGSRSQDFRHAPVGNFILRLERIFRSAYGRDNLSEEMSCTGGVMRGGPQ